MRELTAVQAKIVRRWHKAAPWLCAVVVTLGPAGLARAVPSNPSQRALTAAVTRYLSDHGDLCVGKYAWPRVVTPEDQQARTNDAVQLPVLERLGLVESSEMPASGAAATSATARRYSLTAKGRQYYVQKKRITVGNHDALVEHDEDLCVARLTLDKVVKWSPPEDQHGHLQTLVRYTYDIEFPDWLEDPQARDVFPVVDRIIRGRRNLLMTVNVRLQDGQWIPVLPGQ